MCFGSQPDRTAVTPAPAPPPPAETANQEDIATARAQEDKALFGSDTPSTRVDRSLQTGASGTGIRM